MGGLSLAELGILDWIAAHLHTGWLDVLMPAVTRLGDAGVVWIVLGLVLLLFVRKRRAVGAQLLLALLLSLLLCNLLLKESVGRIRPFDLKGLTDLLIEAPTDPSFPSGHTSASFAAAGVFLLTRTPGRWVVLGLACAIAFSRLYLYVHFPTDVLGGAVVGLICAVLATQLWRRWLSRHRPFRYLI